LNWIREKPAAILVLIIFWEVLLRIFSPAAKFPRRCQPDKYTGQQQDNDDQDESHPQNIRNIEEIIPTRAKIRAAVILSIP